MIVLKKAPAGIIGQYFTDDKRPFHGVPNQGYRAHQFLDVTGGWCETEEEAIAGVKKAREKKIKALEKRLEKVTRELTEEIRNLKETSDTTTYKDQ